MITEEQIKNLVIALKSHTESSTKYNQRGTLPYTYRARKNVMYPGSVDLISTMYGVRPDSQVIPPYRVQKKEHRTLDKVIEHDNTIMYGMDMYEDDGTILDTTGTPGTDMTNRAVYYWQMNHLVDVDRYHYNDKWYPAVDSVDYPYKSFGIFKIDHMAYTTFEYLMNKKSFIMRMDSMMYAGLCEPFMLFLDNKFVNWYDIDIVYDCGDTYLLLHGTDYTFEKLKTKKMCMVILPYNLDYIGVENEDMWDINYDMLTEYLQSTLELRATGKIHITVPEIDTVYDTGSAVYSVGAWMFTQIRMYYTGLLSEEHETKLKKITLTYYEYDQSGNVIDTIITRFNALDRDSYDMAVFNKICHMGYDMYIEKALFRFNDDTGLLDMENGDNIIALMDESIYTDYVKFDADVIHYNQANVNQILRDENYLTFVNGLFAPEAEFYHSILNNIYINNPDKDEYEIFTFLNPTTENSITLYDHFEQNYLNSLVQADIGVHDNEDYAALIKKLKFRLDYKFLDKKLYEQNQRKGFNSIMKFDPRLFNSLYTTNIHSYTFTGSEANNNLVCTWGPESRIGLKIPRYGYKSHETYVMVYQNGELIDTYYRMIAFANFFFIPMDEDYFADSDTIEVVYITDINNNEIHFELTENILDNCFKTIRGDDYKMTTDIFDQYILPYDLKIFCDYPQGILKYLSLIDKSEDISFNISYREDGDAVYVYKELFDEVAYDDNGEINTDIQFTAVSERKFIYERLYVDQYSYRIKLSGRFRYCDNQKQYMLFINGRRIANEGFLITIPKWTRPFWGIYLYTARFVSPEDRIELFYMPYEVMNMNPVENPIVNIDESGYMEVNRDLLKVPLDGKFYELFMNGKHIPSDWLTSIDTHTVRFIEDPKTLQNITMTDVSRDSLNKVVKYMQSDKMSAYDDMIDFIKTSSLGYDELDNLFNIHTKLTDSESDMIAWNTGPIAIINEIIRDFWVTSGYQYNDVVKFIYDYALDEYLVWDEDRELRILPSMDANQYINIQKNYIHLLYFLYDPEENVREIGSTLDEVTLNWEYSTPLYGDNGVVNQWVNGEDIGNEARSYYDNTGWNEEITFTLTGDTTSGSIQASVTYYFYNGIYYGVVDEDSLQWYMVTDEYLLENMYFVRPDDQILPKSSEQEAESKTLSEVKKNNTIIEDIELFGDTIDGTIDDGGTSGSGDDDGPAYGYNSAGVIEYYKPEALPLMMPDLTKVLQDTVNLDLEDYVIGPNHYFVYAAPYRLCWQGAENVVRFIGPDIMDLETREANIDEHTDPLYTNGWWDAQGQPIRLTEFKMEYMGMFTYANPSGYTEPYCMWKSNGFFTRSYESQGFHIIVYDCNNPV